MSVPNDDELRARFAELRAFDSRSRPEFDAVVARGAQRAAAARPRRAAAPIWIAAAAIVVAVAAAGVAWRTFYRGQPREPEVVESISTRP